MAFCCEVTCQTLLHINLILKQWFFYQGYKHTLRVQDTLSWGARQVRYFLMIATRINTLYPLHLQNDFSVIGEKRKRWLKLQYWPRCTVRTFNHFHACNKGTQMNCWETMYMQQLYQREILIEEQQVFELNPLYNCIYDTRPPLCNLTIVSDITVRNTYLQEDMGIT